MKTYTVLFSKTHKMFTLYREHLTRHDMDNVVLGLIGDMEEHPVWNDSYYADIFLDDKLIYTMRGTLTQLKDPQIWEPDGNTLLWIKSYANRKEYVYKPKVYKLYTVNQIMKEAV